MVSPFLIFFPISINFLAPGSGAWYAVPIIGDVISVPDLVFKVGVEAMKTMNHIPSTADGTVKEICVDDGQPVEFGQTIIILE